MLIVWGYGAQNQEQWQAYGLPSVVWTFAGVTTPPVAMDLCDTLVVYIGPDRTAAYVGPDRTDEYIGPVRTVEDFCP